VDDASPSTTTREELPASTAWRAFGGAPETDGSSVDGRLLMWQGVGLDDADGVQRREVFGRKWAAFG